MPLLAPHALCKRGDARDGLWLLHDGLVVSPWKSQKIVSLDPPPSPPRVLPDGPRLVHCLSKGVIRNHVSLAVQDQDWAANFCDILFPFEAMLPKREGRASVCQAAGLMAVLTCAPSEAKERKVEKGGERGGNDPAVRFLQAVDSWA